MYQISRLGRKTLITPREVIFHAPVGHTIDERNYWNNVIIAEERFIAPALGRDLYEAILNEKNTVIDSGNQAAQLVLINAYLTANGEATISSGDLPVGSIVNAYEYLTTPAYQTLWNQYLWKLIAECVEYMAIVPTWLQHTSQGQVMNSPSIPLGSGSTSGEMKDIRYKKDSYLQDRIDPLLAAMRYFLCKNVADYSLYTLDCDCDTPDGISVNRKSAFIFGAYDEDDDCSTCQESYS